DAQALQMPVLRQMVPYLVTGSSALEATTGELTGRVSGGVFRISELTLENALTQLILSGTITVAGRLDLDVTAVTSRAGMNPVLLRLLAQGLPPVGPVPVTLVLKASDLFAERMVHLRVGGTVRNPRVQVEPIRLLSEQAVRFFLTRAVQHIR